MRLLINGDTNIFSYLLSVFCLVLFFFGSLAYGGVVVVIETEQPENDFVISCQWYSDFLNLHGGSKLSKENIFIGSSGEEIDCGWSLFGKGPSVNIMHPLYVDTFACAYSSECNTSYSHYENNKVVIKPTSIKEYLNVLESKYTGEELINIVTTFSAAHFDDIYFRNYDRISKIDIARFKQAYRKRLQQFWKRAAIIGQFEEVSSDPDSAIAAYMRKSK